MILAKYDSYNNSDIQFLSEHPTHWKIRRVKELFSDFGSGSTPYASNPYYYDDADINWLNTTDLNNSEVTSTKHKTTPLAIKDYSLRTYPKNSIAMAMYGQGKTRGMVGLLKIETTTNQASCIMFGEKKVVLRFVLWSFIARYDTIRSINTGTTQPNMNQDFIRNICLFYPPYEEQKSISKFLDKKTSEIDVEIKLLRRRINSYEDLKKALINEIVCRGLNKEIKLKDSNVAWIGKIPIHWCLERNKNIFLKYNNKVGNKSKSYDVLSLTLKGVIVRDMDSGKGKFAASLENYQIVKPDSILLCLFDMDVTPRIVGYVTQKGIITSAYKNIVNKKGHSKYYYYFFLNQDRDKSLLANGAGLRTTLKYDYFGFLFSPFPPENEQIEIANYLDEKTSKIDGIVRHINDQINTLVEFRKTLINDIVTGKVRVENE